MSRRSVQGPVFWAGLICLGTGLLIGRYLISVEGERPPRQSGRIMPATSQDEHSDPSAQKSVEEEFEAFWSRIRGTRTGQIRGKILSEHGLPVEFPLPLLIKSTDPSYVQAHRVLSDASGSFTVEDVKYPLSYEVVCSSQEHGVEYRNRFSMNSSPYELVLRVEQKSVVRGTVLAKDGSPVPNARVVLVISRRRADEGMRQQTRRTLSDEEGRFSMKVRRIPADVPGIKIGASAPGFWPAEGEHDPPSGTTIEARVVLRRAGVIRGTLVDENSRPLGGAEIRVASTRVQRSGQTHASDWLMTHMGGYLSVYGEKDAPVRHETVALTDRADAQGVFAVTPAFAEAEVVLVAIAKDRPPWAKKLFEFRKDSRARVDLGTIRIPRPEKPVSIVLRYADGTPATGVRVRFQAAFVPMWAQINSDTFVVNDEGEIRSTFLAPDQPYSLYVRGGPRRVHANLMDITIRDGRILTIPG